MANITISPIRSRAAWIAGVLTTFLATGLGTATPARAIGGGHPAPDGAYPFVVKLDIGDRSCTGALIDPQWVVTASTCFDNSPAGPPQEPTTATIGRTVLSSSDGQVRPIIDLVPRPGRNVVLARLGTPVIDVTPVKIGTTAPHAGDVLEVAGFGRTTTEWVPDQLHTATFSVQSVADTTLSIAGETPPGAATCRGDAGGPAFRETSGSFELLAINHTSWQHGCLGETETRQGATETRLDDISSWLEQQMIGLAATAAPKHAINLSWIPVWAQASASYRVYGSTSPEVPLEKAKLLGTTSEPRFTHGTLPPKQTWYYRVVPVNAAGQDGQVSVTVSAITRVPTGTDFDGDSKDDIATFTRGDLADVFVSLSDGTKFAEAARTWHDYFAAGQEIPLAGDFNGDRKTDIVTFTRGDSGLAIVSLSNGSGFEPATTWHGHFVLGDEVPAVGDFNGDGRDDIAVFTRGERADVFVSLSDGTKFVQDAWKWHDYFAAGQEIPSVGDFNGDGKTDIVTFTRGDSGLAIVSLSTGSGFEPATTWHSRFALGDEVPAVGDFSGDGRDDIVTFTRGELGDVFVGLSDGATFDKDTSKWHERFALAGEIPAVGDFNGDGKADVAVFTRGDLGDVFVSLSDGTKFVREAWKWHDYFAIGNEIPLPSRIL
jgi:Trypsin/FG-GAP-like repeat/FG-GAP repeat